MWQTCVNYKLLKIKIYMEWVQRNLQKRHIMRSVRGTFRGFEQLKKENCIISRDLTCLSSDVQGPRKKKLINSRTFVLFPYS